MSLAGCLFSLLAWQGVPAELGAEAPAHCWYTTGGSAARTGVSLTPPLRGQPEVAWEYPGRGLIIGEPLVWQEIVVLEEHEGGDRRSLVVVDLLTGELIARERFQSNVPLRPTLWNRVVVVRSAPRQLTAIRIYSDTLKVFHRWDCESEVYDPLLIEGFVFVRYTNQLVALRLWHAEPMWSRAGSFRGRLSLRGNLLYVLRYSETGMAQLVTLDWRLGRIRQEVNVAHHNGRRPSRMDDVTVSVLDRQVFVNHTLPVPMQGGGRANTTVTARLLNAPEAALGTTSLVRSRGSFASWNGGWIGQFRMDDESRLLIHSRDLVNLETLASPDHHPEFLTDVSEPTLARNVAYVGASAVDLDSSQILWRLDASPLTRLVPARETLLYVSEKYRLVALREAKDASRSPRLLQLPAEDTEAFKGRAVLRDGAVVHGSFSVSATDADWTNINVSGRRHGRRVRWSLGDLLWLEDEEGRARFAAPGGGMQDGLDILVQRELAREYTELAAAAMSAGDPELLAHLLGEATRRGSEDWQAMAGAEDRLRRYEELIQAGRTPRISERKVRSIVQREQELRELPGQLLWQRIREVPDDASWDVRVDLLRAVLEADPRHKEARDLVRGLLPRGVIVQENFDALDWLDFVEALRHTEIRFVNETPPGREPTHAELELRAAQAEWRRDLVGIASPSLLVITPLQNPGRIARCLAVGELVCDTLEDLFASGRHQRDERLPLKLFLYETEDEYRRQSKIPVESLEWTAGHYSMSENVERIFLPHDADAFAQMMNTYAHELTHHWVVERCPRFRGRDLMNMRPDQPGFWIVEGFASLLESFEYDLRAREARPRPLPASLDLVVNAPRDALIPWSALFELTHVQFGKLDRGPGIMIPMSDYLGIGRRSNQTSMFYIQAEAACQYLFHAHGGRHREAMLQFVGDYYSGQRDSLDVQAAFGMTATRLGQEVERYCQLQQREAASR